MKDYRGFLILGLLKEYDDGNEVDISDSQRYKMCGNAVTVNVIEQIFNRIIQRGDFS